jgi:hypothetical protein
MTHLKNTDEVSHAELEKRIVKAEELLKRALGIIKMLSERPGPKKGL